MVSAKNFVKWFLMCMCVQGPMLQLIWEPGACPLVCTCLSNSTAVLGGHWYDKMHAKLALSPSQGIHPLELAMQYFYLDMGSMGFTGNFAMSPQPTLGSDHTLWRDSSLHFKSLTSDDSADRFMKINILGSKTYLYFAIWSKASCCMPVKCYRLNLIK